MLHNFGAIIMSCWVTVISCLLAEELRLQRNIENYALLRRCFPGSNANGSSGGSSTKSSSTTSPLSSTKTGHKATDSSESNFIDRTEFLITKVSFEGFLTRYNIIKRVSHAITNNSVRKKSVNFFFLFLRKDWPMCAEKSLNSNLTESNGRSWLLRRWNPRHLSNHFCCSQARKSLFRANDEYGWNWRMRDIKRLR